MRSMACTRLPAGLPWSAPACTATATAAGAARRPPRPPTARPLSSTPSSSVAAHRFPAATLPRRAHVGAALGAAAPPPPPPVATDAAVRAAEERAARIARRQALAARLRADGAAGGSGSTGSSGNTGSKRFYRRVQVAEDADADADGGAALRILLDTRALRHPGTKAVLRLPATKRLLAHALAVEWDQLASVRQATQAHRVPLTSLVCRAVDLEAPGSTTERDRVVDQLLRFLDTDGVLCWAPPAAADAPAHDAQVRLRRAQEATAGPIVAHVAAHVWPGVALAPVLGHAADGAGGHALLPRAHPPATRAAAAAWLRGLSGWELAGVERATLAGKSLVVAARLVAAWRGTATATDAAPAADDTDPAAHHPFTVDDAVRATSVETAVQTEQWGAVEDTHDVEDADLRRHFGSVVLLVA